mgnify:CR=1 FL=1
METVICPNCGSLISIPKTMPVSVTCKNAVSHLALNMIMPKLDFLEKSR